MDDVKIGSNRSFGIVFFIVFLVIATYPLINNGELRLWSLIISLIFLFLGYPASCFFLVKRSSCAAAIILPSIISAAALS